jgi:serine/threonine protein kinase
MGEVYRATDTVLKRQVALKVLPPDVANDTERVARFQREAEVLASLNHPNVAHLYGLERSGGTLALVMELVEGRTLADRIAKGAISIDEALAIAKQIAEAIEAAHEYGIIHRDLKPANIKVRDDGTVKVLDFGLAKAMEPLAGGASPAALLNSPTITSPALTTGPGVLLGTAAYMSPEQAKERPADKRSDIWAFGCVLFEMLTGTLAFDGDSVSETLANILHHEPDWSRVQATADVQRLLKTCLQKELRRRLRDVADAQLFLESADRPLTDGDVSAPAFVLSIVAEEPIRFPHRGEQVGAPLISPDATAVVSVPYARKLTTWTSRWFARTSMEHPPVARFNVARLPVPNGAVEGVARRLESRLASTPSL